MTLTWLSQEVCAVVETKILVKESQNNLILVHLYKLQYVLYLCLKNTMIVLPLLQLLLYLKNAFF